MENGKSKIKLAEMLVKSNLTIWQLTAELQKIDQQLNNVTRINSAIKTSNGKNNHY